MENMVQSAALGAAFGLLLASVADAIRNIAHFNADLNRLKSTLCSIELVVDHNENNKILEGRQHETQLIDQLREGKKLIQKCSKVKWNVFKMLYYSMKLTELEGLLRIHLQIDAAASSYRRSNDYLKKLATMPNKYGNGGCGPNSSPAGHEQSFQMKEGLPLEDGEVDLEMNSSLAGHEQSFQMKEGLQLEDGVQMKEGLQLEDGEVDLEMNSSLAGHEQSSR